MSKIKRIVKIMAIITLKSQRRHLQMSCLVQQNAPNPQIFSLHWYIKHKSWNQNLLSKIAAALFSGINKSSNRVSILHSFNSSGLKDPVTNSLGCFFYQNWCPNFHLNLMSYFLSSIENAAAAVAVEPDSCKVSSLHCCVHTLNKDSLYPINCISESGSCTCSRMTVESNNMM